MLRVKTLRNFMSSSVPVAASISAPGWMELSTSSSTKPHQVGACPEWRGRKVRPMNAYVLPSEDRIRSAMDSFPASSSRFAVGWLERGR